MSHTIHGFRGSARVCPACLSNAEIQFRGNPSIPLRDHYRDLVTEIIAKETAVVNGETEFEFAVRLANKVLDRPYGDPDDDLAVLARQFLRAVERLDPISREGA
jgi:hypothetical protein